MDSMALLDYAMFQLTPTRTRCDLVVFSGKSSEKIASGLVEPFISHLKYARDQISKGGYSITLRAPDASWFTKATFQRFVRFVSTPEIIESVVRIEREISQIQSNEALNMDVEEHPVAGNLGAADGNAKKSSISSKLPSEELVNGAATEENSRVHLQRLMDTRKALLQKEQAMAYARAVVAGYGIDTIDDIISFADTFGASRMREACVDFKELYNRKHSDDQWKDELAAVQAHALSGDSYLGASGNFLAAENIQSNGISSVSSKSISELVVSPNSDGSKVNNQPVPEQTLPVQSQLPWMNQIPQYLYNFQNPAHQTPASYQGYPFPGMQPYYPGHMGWPPRGAVVSQSEDDHSQKPSRKKNSLDAKGLNTSEEYMQSASSDSYSGSDSDDVQENAGGSSKGKEHKKNSKKKSSKTVVIRNINYITSQRHSGEANEVSDSSSGRTLSLDEASIREGLDSALASLDLRANSKSRKSRGERGTPSQNGSSVHADGDSRNDYDSTVYDGEKTGNTWDALQNLLMAQEEPASNALSKHRLTDSFGEHHKMNDDSALAIQRGRENNGTEIIDFMNGERMNSNMKKNFSRDENALFSRELEASRMSQLGTPDDFAAESSVMKHQKGEDWFVVRSPGGSRAHDSKQVEYGNHESWSHDGGHVHKETTATTPVVVDDSFIIQTRPTNDESNLSNWKTDLGMIPDIDNADHLKNNVSKVGESESTEPNDLCMVLVRESHESTETSWTPEMDYQLEIPPADRPDQKSLTAESNGRAKKDPMNGKGVNGTKNLNNGKGPGRDVRSKASTGSLAKGNEYLSKNRKLPLPSRSMSQKSKFDKDEAERKRKEEMLIERQKRIAERTTAGGLNASKKVSVPWK